MAHAGRMGHAAREVLPRHPHCEAFAAVVLRGGYIEAGDTGRHHLGPGDVLIHRPFERHQDHFGSAGAEVLILDIEILSDEPAGRVADPDLLVRLSETSPVEAGEALQDMWQPRCRLEEDWPELLAMRLHRDPSLSLRAFCHEIGIHAGSASRAFRQVFGVTPAEYRTVQRAHKAAKAIRQGDGTLVQIACDAGFADQPHMSRAVRTLTGLSPLVLRKWCRPQNPANPPTSAFEL